MAAVMVVTAILKLLESMAISAAGVPTFIQEAVTRVPFALVSEAAVIIPNTVIAGTSIVRL